MPTSGLDRLRVWDRFAPLDAPPRVPAAARPWTVDCGLWLTLSAAGDVEGSFAAVQQLLPYLAAQLAERRTNPRHDMLSDIVALRFDGEPLPETDALMLTFLLMQAGHETTIGAIGGMLFHVGSNPELKARLLANPSLIPLAVEEALRLEAPLMGLGRILTTDATMEGVTMPKGDRVMLMFGAANRDETVFEDPETFVVDRTNNRHMAFGSGVHRCLGAPLARLEMRVVLEEVLQRMPGVHIVDGDAVEVRYSFNRAYRRLDVRGDLGPSAGSRSVADGHSSAS